MKVKKLRKRVACAQYGKPFFVEANESRYVTVRQDRADLAISLFGVFTPVQARRLAAALNEAADVVAENLK